jgi:pimeloyl-ACP methyl ester carboxylesterase
LAKHGLQPAIFGWRIETAPELLIGSAVFVTLVVLAGLVLQEIGSARDARRFLPPGQMVDVGGHQLHICATGRGSPTVVLDSGFPGSSLSWTYVQPEVTRFTRACSYDRAGLGWSDAGPMPRTTRQIVEELHALLRNAQVKGPYVLVGHSFGTFTVRLYASTYPDEVAGIVLLDPIQLSDWLNMTEAGKRKLMGAVRLARYGAILARLEVARLVGLSDDEVCIGDRYRIGSAMFEVTQPRVTCYRVGIRMDEPRMPCWWSITDRVFTFVF